MHPTAPAVPIIWRKLLRLIALMNRHPILTRLAWLAVAAALQYTAKLIVSAINDSAVDEEEDAD